MTTILHIEHRGDPARTDKLLSYHVAIKQAMNFLSEVLINGSKEDIQITIKREAEMPQAVRT
jgi:hypothetical protein